MNYEQTSRLHRPERRQFLLTGLGLAAAASLSGCFDDDKIDLADQKLITLDGETVHLNVLKGQPAAIAFWATTCPGCIDEIPHIVALHEKFTPRGANIVGISMDLTPSSRCEIWSKHGLFPTPSGATSRVKRLKPLAG
ncbi:MAG TPA: redoxin domain-containing protein [Halothiobacillaceae bacterium]|nr:redoxin domain-containing protein [Halothiobacillaceae bacterium]